jgi:hypothetical protein
MRRCAHILWLCLLCGSGCALESAPSQRSDQLHPAAESAMWAPEPLSTQPGTTTATAHTPAPASAGTSASTAGTQAPASAPPDSAPTASTPPPAAAEPEPTPAVDPGAEPSAPQPSAAMPARDAGSDSAAPTEEDDTEPVDRTRASAQLVEAVSALLDQRSQRGKKPNNDQLKEWRKDTRRSPQLTAELVQTALTVLQKDGDCKVRPDPCRAVCQAVGRDCAQCSADASCAAKLADVCAGPPEGC